jgi:hypothetical protein
LPRLAAIPRGDNALRFFVADGQGEEPSQKQRMDLWLPVIPVKVDLKTAAGDNWETAERVSLMDSATCCVSGERQSSLR